MNRVTIRERYFSRRLVIDVNPITPLIRPVNMITFDHESAAHAAAQVVEAWIKAADKHDGVGPYLPDLILEHASEWGLQ